MKRRMGFMSLLLLFILLISCAKNFDSPSLVEKNPLDQKTNKMGENVATDIKKTNIDKKKDILAFVPDGWHILEPVKGDLKIAEGDLNKDEISDIAFVIEETSKSEETASRRALLIAFGNNDNTYSFLIRADNAILKADEGGVWGDPFEGISIDRGSLLINFYGGSNWRWYSRYRFRFQDNDWYLIGATLGSYFTGTTTIDNADEEDYNLLTGDLIEKKTDENGKTMETKSNRGKKVLIKLKDFIADSEEKQF